VIANSPIEGSNFTASDAGDPMSYCGWCPDMFGVRNTPAGQAWYDSLFRLCASWDLDYVKVDDLSQPYSTHEIEMIRAAIDKCGRPIVFSTSPGPAPVGQSDHLLANANLWRISGDFWDRWQRLDEQFDRIGIWQGVARPGGWPDADMLPLGHLAIRSKLGGEDHWTHFTKAEQRTLISLWSLAPSPLMLGANLPDLDAWTLALLTNDQVLAVNQDRVAKPAVRVWQHAGTEAWVKELADGGRAVGFFNRCDSEKTIEVSWKQLGFDGVQRARDLWQARDVPTTRDSIKPTIAPHDCALWKTTPRN